MNNDKTRNSIKQERLFAVLLGFNLRLAKNPVMILNDGSMLIWLAGRLIGRATTETFFNTGQHLKTWKASNRNASYSRMTSTQTVYKDGQLTKETQLYYRQAKKHQIKAIAEATHRPEETVILDHINRRAGDDRDENTEPASSRQNNLNRGKPLPAFYTVEEVIDNINKGIWVPVNLKTEKCGAVNEE